MKIIEFDGTKKLKRKIPMIRHDYVAMGHKCTCKVGLRKRKGIPVGIQIETWRCDKSSITHSAISYSLETYAVINMLADEAMRRHYKNRALDKKQKT